MLGFRLEMVLMCTLGTQAIQGDIFTLSNVGNDIPATPVRAWLRSTVEEDISPCIACANGYVDM
jgi:hypothetical protein